MSTDGEHAPPESPAQVGLRAHEDARDIIRLLQCSQCSYPLREPMTLPCGSSLCRVCLPSLYKRENITYPLNEGRSEGFLCPFKECRMEHSMGDCSTDVTLNKVLDVVKSYISSHKTEVSETPLLLEEQLHLPDGVDSSMDVMPRRRTLHGGRLLATYVLAEMGELNYHSGLSYTALSPDPTNSIQALDNHVLHDLREAARNELECQVCYAVMLEPVTTSCGHSYCRRCIARVLDHSNLCPICRRRLPLAPGVQGEPGNKKITLMVEGVLTEALGARLAAAQAEDAVNEDVNIPLFPCSLAYPMMPTFLHIFEPRYRLMIRRVMENGSRKFGMMMYNSHRLVQGHLGQVHFMQYGTLLHVERVESLPDGRSLVETKGMSRFRVMETSMFDGYSIGRIEKVEDIPIAEEEAIEARETSGPAPAEDNAAAQIEHMPTQRLLEYGLDFVARSRARSATWLHQRILAAYGQPPTDPALFPYWLASILPIADDQKYRLLPTTTVRERLKITAEWVHRLEAARCEQEAERRVRREAALGAATAAAAAAGERQREESGISAQLSQPENAETGLDTSSEAAEQIHELPAENSPRETPAPQSETETEN